MPSIWVLSYANRATRKISNKQHYFHTVLWYICLYYIIVFCFSSVVALCPFFLVISIPFSGFGTILLRFYPKVGNFSLFRYLFGNFYVNKQSMLDSIIKFRAILDWHFNMTTPRKCAQSILRTIHLTFLIGFSKCDLFIILLLSLCGVFYSVSVLSAFVCSFLCFIWNRQWPSPWPNECECRMRDSRALTCFWWSKRLWSSFI